MTRPFVEMFYPRILWIQLHDGEIVLFETYFMSIVFVSERILSLWCNFDNSSSFLCISFVHPNSFFFGVETQKFLLFECCCNFWWHFDGMRFCSSALFGQSSHVFSNRSLILLQISVILDWFYLSSSLKSFLS